MSFRSSEIGKVIGGDYITLSDDTLNRDVYMPLTAKYMDTISIVYFAVVGTIGFIQFCSWLYKRLGQGKE